MPYPEGVGVAGFDALTLRALQMARDLPEPFAALLRLLRDCCGERHGRSYNQQQQGASYKALALAAHRAGLTAAERRRWYRISESIPLSQRHVGHVLARLGAGRAPPGPGRGHAA